MSKGNGSKPAMVLLLFCALGVGALAWYVKADPKAAHVTKLARNTDDFGDDAPEVTVHTHRHARPADDGDTAPETKSSEQIRLPEIKGEDVSLQSDKVDVPDGEDSKKFLAERVVKDLSLSNVTVHGVDVRNGVAVINFGGDIDAGMGSEQEGNFLKELQTGFGQFSQIKRIEIDKEGEPLESLGHIDLTDPIPVTRPGESESGSEQGSGAMPLE